ncbi:MAG: MFS transporter [Eudoraea sp.]|nr:MFS transporter [Eudoraea sp.]
MKMIYTSYVNSFRGLSREIWWLALITLINRAGTMVIPFLSLYLTQDLGFSLEKVGIIMTCFGIGSFIGSWVGGKLTDIFGYYKVMLISLLFTGLLFIWIQVLSSFIGVCLGILILMSVADAFRPAALVALSAYSKQENKTRSITLIRLAINLGFSAGPALGGIVIASMGYYGLFWIDGITCILAGVLLLFVLHPKKAREIDTTQKVENPRSAFRDRPYMLFIAALVLFGFIFMQYFSTVPLYYNEVRSLSEFEIGLLLAMNGFIIFAFEMPLIKYMETRPFSKITHVILGIALVILSFIFLTIGTWVGMLVLGMVLMTIGEMIAFPFSNAFAMDRSRKGKQGEYMALYSIAFSVAHIFGHNSGMVSISYLGFETTWYGAAIIGLLGIMLLLGLKRMMRLRSIKKKT